MTNRFEISSEHKSFTDRQKSLFDHLETAEKNATNTLKSQSAMEVEEASNTNIMHKDQILKGKIDSRPRNPRMRQYKARESIFKRPEAPIGRCLPPGRTPGFRKNPNKWTKYTLEDVKDEDMSDKSNTRTALAFLKDLEKGRADNEEKIDVLPDKIVFKKSAMIRKKTEISTDDNIEERPSFRSSKVVMPEYVVGQGVKKCLKKKRNLALVKESTGGGRPLKLDHLNEYDDDEED